MCTVDSDTIETNADLARPTCLWDVTTADLFLFPIPNTLGIYKISRNGTLHFLHSLRHDDALGARGEGGRC